MYLFIVAALVAVLLFCGKQAAAQTTAASASVTIQSADPLLRPVPETGFGVSYNQQAEQESACLSQSIRRRSQRPMEPNSRNNADCVQLRNPAGHSFANHKIVPQATAASEDTRHASPRREIIVALE